MTITKDKELNEVANMLLDTSYTDYNRGTIAPTEKLREKFIKKECTHENTQIAARHESGIKLIKCCNCNAYI